MQQCLRCQSSRWAGRDISFWWVQNDFLTPPDHQANCSSSPAAAVWEFAVLPFQEPFGSNIKGDLLWRKMQPVTKVSLASSGGQTLTSLCGTLEISPFKINKEPCDTVGWITLPGLLGPQFWTSQKENFQEKKWKASIQTHASTCGFSFWGQTH